MYVDGKGVLQTEDNTEILDDWPMHVANDIKVFSLYRVTIKLRPSFEQV
jgi:hypothetical protein